MVNPPDRASIFDAVPDACLVLDQDLHMVDANPAHLALAGRTLDEIVGRAVADAFPVNPDDPRAADRLEAGYREVLRTGRLLSLGVVRYDLATAEPGVFEHRYWSVTLSPLAGGPGTAAPGQVQHVLQRSRDVTEVHADLLRALELLRTHTDLDPARVQALLEQDRDAVSTSDLSAALAAEVEQLHEAMASRAGIEQAKGVLMGATGCTADEAFQRLVHTSQHTNRKLRAIAEDVLAARGPLDVA